MKYSVEFENDIASYATGSPQDRSEKTLMELYTKLEWTDSFYDFCQRYFDLAGKRFLEVGCGTGYVSVSAARRGAIVSATDFVPKCLELTAKRLREHNLTAHVYQSDLQTSLGTDTTAKF